MLVLGFTLLTEQTEPFICISPTRSYIWQTITTKSMNIDGCFHRFFF